MNAVTLGVDLLPAGPWPFDRRNPVRIGSRLPIRGAPNTGECDVLDRLDHRKLVEDDRETLEQFLEGLESLVLTIARGRYRFRVHEAEDILLEVLRKLWVENRAALMRWRGEGSFEAYLSAIVHRFCLMELRRRRRRVPEIGTEDLDRFHAPRGDEPLERDQFRRLYSEAARQLSERDRRLLRLRFIEEREYSEIVSEMEISTGAARKAVHSALARLRRRLQEIAPELFRPRRTAG